MNCDIVRKYITNEILTKVFQSYLLDSRNDNSPSLDKFLNEFGLKRILSESTTWKWLTHLGFQHNERNKSYFMDCHESEENRDYRKKL